MADPECANVTTLFTALEDFSPAFEVYSAVFFATVVTVILVSLGAWYRRRHHPYLAPRRFSLVLVSCAGIFMQLIPGTLERAGVPVPCFLDLFTFQVCIIVGAWPLTVRMLSFYFQILYNQILAEQLVVELDGGSLVSNKPYMRQKWRASSRFRLMLTTSVLALFCVLAVISSILSCLSVVGRCTPLEVFQPAINQAFAFFAVLVGFLLAVNLYTVYLTRDSPDPIDIRRETIRAWLVAVVVSVPGLIGYLGDIGGYNRQTDSNFTWLVFVDWAFFIFLLLSVTLPVYKSHSATTEYRITDFPAFLDSPEGLRFFASYLATEVSLDNLLFYRAVLKWIDNFDESSPEYRHNQASRILNDYLLPYAEHEVFVGYRILSRIKDTINGLDEITKDMFDEAKNEIMRVMYTDSFSRFERSNFYKLYLHEVEPEGSTAAEYEAIHFIEGEDDEEDVEEIGENGRPQSGAGAANELS